MKKNLAIHGGEKAVKRNFQWPIFDDSDVNAIADVARSGKWGNPDCLGLVQQFEKEFAAYCGSKYAISCVIR